jgi:hypothetical protein
VARFQAQAPIVEREYETVSAFGLGDRGSGELYGQIEPTPSFKTFVILVENRAKRCCQTGFGDVPRTLHLQSLEEVKPRLTKIIEAPEKAIPAKQAFGRWEQDIIQSRIPLQTPVETEDRVFEIALMSTSLEASHQRDPLVVVEAQARWIISR